MGKVRRLAARNGWCPKAPNGAAIGPGMEVLGVSASDLIELVPPEEPPTLPLQS